MKRNTTWLPIAAVAFAALFAGCWGASKSTSVTVAPGGGAETAAAVGVDVCANCHSAQLAQWQSSSHANANGTPSYADFGSDSTCETCHDNKGDGQLIVNFISGAVPRPVTGCESCHGGGALHFGSGPIEKYAAAATSGKSAQYNTCIACHPENGAPHAGSTGRIISDTHFDNQYRADGSTIQGYVIRKAASSACTDCHRRHTFDLTENRQWAASAHGDRDGEAWKHYDWKDTSRQACQRCHTTTGFVNYTNDQAGYNPANNVFVAVDNQSEMLYCYGCHATTTSGYQVARRTVSTAYLPAGPGVNDNVAITGKGDSELCLNCHSGREPGSQVRANMAGKNMDNTVFGAFNSHYLLAGATLFQDNNFSTADNQFVGPGAYQFNGKDYAKPSQFEHDTIGGATQGPCVGCHMTTPNSSTDETIGKHSFMPVTVDDTGAITAVTSAKCAECHTGSDAMTASRLDALRTQYENRVDALKSLLESKGIYWGPSYPYFFANAGLTVQFKTWQTKAASLGISTEELVGVAFNLNYFKHEPGAYAHNSTYTARVLYDSIEKLGGTPGFARP